MVKAEKEEYVYLYLKKEHVYLKKPNAPRFKHNPILSNDQRKELKRFLDDTEPKFWFPPLMSDEQITEAKKALQKFFERRTDFNVVFAVQEHTKFEATFYDKGDLNCKLCELQFLQLRDNNGCLIGNEVVWKEAKGDETFGKYKFYEVHFEEDENIAYEFVTRINFL